MAAVRSSDTGKADAITGSSARCYAHDPRYSHPLRVGDPALPSHSGVSFFVAFGNQPGRLTIASRLRGCPGRLELRPEVRVARLVAPGGDADALCRSDSVQHLAAVH